MEEFQTMLPLEERDIEHDKAADKGIIAMIEEKEEEREEQEMQAEEKAKPDEEEEGREAKLGPKKAKGERKANAHAPKYVKVTLGSKAIRMPQRYQYGYRPTHGCWLDVTRNKPARTGRPVRE